ncbi:hypothetical protein BC834DRAFT_1038476 [Gloeopeniophorella convolvens]|nr:hypothetical protein BC834DRAFT_1038476 [Gloeopeniophorella convolvens]
MGFFQKFLSLGSRKNRKRRAPLPVEARSAPAFSREEARRPEDDGEAVENRLLRSSSMRYAVVNEVDYASLPPIPHPVNSLNRTPVLTSSAASTLTRRTYTVTVHDKKVEALTEFPNANPPLETPTRPSHSSGSSSGHDIKHAPITPKDQSRLNALRQDPSVASLLDMYDSQGRVNSIVFSNASPVKTSGDSHADGRAQVKRSGSTLRQLLGNPEPINRTSTAEGDISWAEAFLRDAESHGNSTDTSSIRLTAPKNESFVNVLPNVSESNPNIAITSDDYHLIETGALPLISSMEVEPSVTPDQSHVPSATLISSLEMRPAAEVFSFLLDKRRNSMRKISEPLPSRPNFTRDVDPSNGPSSIPPATPLQRGRSASIDTPSSIGSILADPPHAATILNHTRIPIAHGKLPEGHRAEQITFASVAARPSRIPRGTRSSSETQLPLASTEAFKPTQIPAYSRDALRSNNVSARTPAVSHTVSKSEEIFTPVPSRKPQRRSASYGSSALISESWQSTPGAIKPRADGDKENSSPAVGVDENAGAHSRAFSKSRLPVTPSRHRALLAAAPSPASSTELSPLGQKMMADLRKQRQARGERRRSRFAESTAVA